MTLDELDKLAKVYVDAIYTNRLTKREIVVLVSLIDARVKMGKPAEVEKTVPVAEPPKVKSIVYDPMYDPAPPMEPELVPPRAEITRETILAPKNFACMCNACNKVIYTCNKDVKDGITVREFIESYTPMAGYEPLPKKAEIQNIEGTISTDCPDCKGSKTLYLTRKK